MNTSPEFLRLLGGGEIVEESYSPEVANNLAQGLAATSGLALSTLRAILLDPNVYVEDSEDGFLVDGRPSLTDEQLALVRSIVAERT